MDALRAIRRNKVSTAFAIGILGCLLASSGNVRQNFEAISRVRESTQRNTEQEMRLQASQQASEAQAEIAEARYKAGCVMVVAMRDPNSYTSLSEGQPVIDRVRKTPLPVGTVVCDANGNTAKIIPGVKQPVVGEVAYTGNAEVIQAARKSSSAKYKLPNQ